jgi:hypothetical protein
MFTPAASVEQAGHPAAGRRREEFREEYKTTLFEAYGCVMKEYVAVPDAMLKNTKELKKYLEISYGYAKTLKPKPSRRSREHGRRCGAPRPIPRPAGESAGTSG